MEYIFSQESQQAGSSEWVRKQMIIESKGKFLILLNTNILINSTYFRQIWMQKRYKVNDVINGSRAA